MLSTLDLKRSCNANFCPTYFLDGGLGTTLEDVFYKDISAPLWSASLVKNEAKVIEDAHLEFMKAGARIVLTSTYQCSFSTFAQSGYSESDATGLMRRAVDLVAGARSQFVHQHGRTHPSSLSPKVKIALSLGPFGASLSPAQEFDGFYPHPYGSKGYTLIEPNTNAYGEGDFADEQLAQKSLEEFHYERIRVFADHKETWEKIDYVAFETVPLAREVKAIRGAVGRLIIDLKRDGDGRVQREDSDESLMKPWWISTVWPNGLFPQEASPGGPRLSHRDVMKSLVGNASPSLPTPSAIGINCSDVSHLSSIVEQFRTYFTETDSSQSFQRGPLSLVLYPNAGYSYDIKTKSWRHPDDEKLSRKVWARKLADVVRRERSSGAWKSIAVGGCCKTGPEHIAALVEELRGSGA